MHSTTRKNPLASICPSRHTPWNFIETCDRGERLTILSSTCGSIVKFSTAKNSRKLNPPAPSIHVHKNLLFLVDLAWKFRKSGYEGSLSREIYGYSRENQSRCTIEGEPVTRQWTGVNGLWRRENQKRSNSNGDILLGPATRVAVLSDWRHWWIVRGCGHWMISRSRCRTKNFLQSAAFIRLIDSYRRSCVIARINHPFESEKKTTEKSNGTATFLNRNA